MQFLISRGLEDITKTFIKTRSPHTFPDPLCSPIHIFVLFDALVSLNVIVWSFFINFPSHLQKSCRGRCLSLSSIFYNLCNSLKCIDSIITHLQWVEYLNFGTNRLASSRLLYFFNDIPQLFSSELRHYIAMFALVTLKWLFAGLHLSYGYLWMIIIFTVLNFIQVCSQISFYSTNAPFSYHNDYWFWATCLCFVVILSQQHFQMFSDLWRNNLLILVENTSTIAFLHVCHAFFIVSQWSQFYLFLFDVNFNDTKYIL